MRWLAVVLLAALPAQAQLTQDERAQLRRELDAPVVAMIDRVWLCNFYAGEEATDAERRRHLERQIAANRCTALQADVKRLREQYANNPATLARFDEYVDAEGYPKK